RDSPPRSSPASNGGSSWRGRSTRESRRRGTTSRPTDPPAGTCADATSGRRSTAHDCRPSDASVQGAEERRTTVVVDLAPEFARRVREAGAQARPGAVRRAARPRVPERVSGRTETAELGPELEALAEGVRATGDDTGAAGQLLDRRALQQGRAVQRGEGARVPDSVRRRDLSPVDAWVVEVERAAAVDRVERQLRLIGKGGDAIAGRSDEPRDPRLELFR